MKSVTVKTLLFVPIVMSEGSEIRTITSAVGPIGKFQSYFPSNGVIPL